MSLANGDDGYRPANASAVPREAEFSKLLTVMATTSKINSWESAFLKEFGPMLSRAGHAQPTMQGFYEAVEAAHGQPGYVYAAPVGHCSVALGSCSCCPKE